MMSNTADREECAEASGFLRSVASKGIDIFVGGLAQAWMRQTQVKFLDLYSVLEDCMVFEIEPAAEGWLYKCIGPARNGSQVELHVKLVMVKGEFVGLRVTRIHNQQ